MVIIKDKDKAINLELSEKEPTSFTVWEARIEHALRNIGDRIALNRSPLAKLSYIEKLASDKYRGYTLPRGLALHEFLISCVRKISAELGDEPGSARACKYLELLAAGMSCREISKQLGLSREHVSRVVRKKALQLITEEVISTLKIR